MGNNYRLWPTAQTWHRSPAIHPPPPCSTTDSQLIFVQAVSCPLLLRSEADFFLFFSFLFCLIDVNNLPSLPPSAPIRLLQLTTLKHSKRQWGGLYGLPHPNYPPYQTPPGACWVHTRILKSAHFHSSLCYSNFVLRPGDRMVLLYHSGQQFTTFSWIRGPPTWFQKCLAHPSQMPCAYSEHVQFNDQSNWYVFRLGWMEQTFYYKLLFANYLGPRSNILTAHRLAPNRRLGIAAVGHHFQNLILFYVSLSLFDRQTVNILVHLKVVCEVIFSLLN